MRITPFINVFFIAFLLNAILNLTLCLTFVSKSLAAIFNYGGFACLIIAFILSTIHVKNEVITIFKKSFQIVLVFLIMYIILVLFAVISDNTESMTTYLPILFRNSIAMVLSLWLFSYIIYYKKIKFYIKAISICVFLSVSSIFIFKQINIEISYLLYTDIDNEEIGRASGSFGNANIAALFCVFAFVFALHYFKEATRKKDKMIQIVLILFIIYNLFLTFSNTGFLNIIIITIISAMSYGKNMKMLIVKFVMVFLFFESLILPVVKINIESYYSQNNIPKIQMEKIDNFINIIGFESTDKMNFSYRDELVFVGLKKIEQSPIIGQGLGSFSLNITGSVGIHNNYLQIMGEAGIPFFLLYLFLFLLFYYRIAISKLHTYKFISLGIITSIAIFMLTSHDVLYTERILLFIVFSYILNQNRDYILKNV
jgi:O-antigen ligase